MRSNIHYTITPSDPAAHYFTVVMRIEKPMADGQCLRLPAWIPGSYMIREFAKNIVQISAKSGRKNVKITQLDKHTWQLAAGTTGPVEVTYRIYAWDMSVRTAYLDQTRGFFNGTSVFLAALGCEQQTVFVTIEPPAAAVQGAAFKNWTVATSLIAIKVDAHGFGVYRASDYDDLVDHPVEMGQLQVAHFKACGAPHTLAFSGTIPQFDLQRVTRDTQKICKAQIELFEPRSAKAPFLDTNHQYVFMTYAVGNGYGGLEHRASTALICKRDDLPVKGQAAMTDGYLQFLGLVSHEYFHTWNVKRIKPAVFAKYDLTQENYTRLLWVFEGFTSYYDDLMLLRAGVIEQAAYLKLLSKTISGVLSTSGRHLHSVAQSSFDAWTKYYRQDENSPNAIVSYYQKGSLVACALDLTIRTKTKGAKSLDDVMRLLWQRYGRDFYLGGGNAGLDEDQFPAVVQEATGIDVSDLIERIAYGTDDAPLQELLAQCGIQWAAKPASDAPSLGVKLDGDKLAQVFNGQAAHAAGLSAGDVLVAINHLRVGGGNSVATLLGRYAAGQTVTVHAFRRDELMQFEVRLQAQPATQVTLSAHAKPNATQRKLLSGWLAP